MAAVETLYIPVSEAETGYVKSPVSAQNHGAYPPPPPYHQPPNGEVAYSIAAAGPIPFSFATSRCWADGRERFSSDIRTRNPKNFSEERLISFLTETYDIQQTINSCNEVNTRYGGEEEGKQPVGKLYETLTIVKNVGDAVMTSAPEIVSAVWCGVGMVIKIITDDIETRQMIAETCDKVVTIVLVCYLFEKRIHEAGESGIAPGRKDLQERVFLKIPEIIAKILDFSWQMQHNVGTWDDRATLTRSKTGDFRALHAFGSKVKDKVKSVGRSLKEAFTKELRGKVEDIINSYAEIEAISDNIFKETVHECVKELPEINDRLIKLNDVVEKHFLDIRSSLSILREEIQAVAMVVEEKSNQVQEAVKGVDQNINELKDDVKDLSKKLTENVDPFADAKRFKSLIHDEYPKYDALERHIAKLRDNANQENVEFSKCWILGDPDYTKWVPEHRENVQFLCVSSGRGFGKTMTLISVLDNLKGKYAIDGHKSPNAIYARYFFKAGDGELERALPAMKSILGQVLRCIARSYFAPLLYHQVLNELEKIFKSQCKPDDAPSNAAEQPIQAVPTVEQREKTVEFKGSTLINPEGSLSHRQQMDIVCQILIALIETLEVPLFLIVDGLDECKDWDDLDFINCLKSLCEATRPGTTKPDIRVMLSLREGKNIEEKVNGGSINDKPDYLKYAQITLQTNRTAFEEFIRERIEPIVRLRGLSEIRCQQEVDDMTKACIQKAKGDFTYAISWITGLNKPTRRRFRRRRMQEPEAEKTIEEIHRENLDHLPADHRSLVIFALRWLAWSVSDITVVEIAEHYRQIYLDDEEDFDPENAVETSSEASDTPKPRPTLRRHSSVMSFAATDPLKHPDNQLLLKHLREAGKGFFQIGEDGYTINAHSAITEWVKLETETREKSAASPNPMYQARESMSRITRSLNGQIMVEFSFPENFIPNSKDVEEMSELFNQEESHLAIAYEILTALNNKEFQNRYLLWNPPSYYSEKWTARFPELVNESPLMMTEEPKPSEDAKDGEGEAAVNENSGDNSGDSVSDVGSESPVIRRRRYEITRLIEHIRKLQEFWKPSKASNPRWADFITQLHIFMKPENWYRWLVYQALGDGLDNAEPDYDYTRYHRSPAHYGCKYGLTLLVEQYLTMHSGAQVDPADAVVNEYNGRGKTPLCYGIKQPQMVKILLEHGAQIDMGAISGIYRSYSASPMIYAFEKMRKYGITAEDMDRQAEFVKILIDNGADVHKTYDYDGEPKYNALQLAIEGAFYYGSRLPYCRQKSIELGKLLIDKGVDLNPVYGGADPPIIIVARETNYYAYTTEYPGFHDDGADFMEYALEKGADPNIESKYTSRKALQQVVESLATAQNTSGAVGLQGLQRIFKTLLSHGAGKEKVVPAEGEPVPEKEEFTINSDIIPTIAQTRDLDILETAFKEGGFDITMRDAAGAGLLHHFFSNVNTPITPAQKNAFLYLIGRYPEEKKDESTETSSPAAEPEGDTEKPTEAEGGQAQPEAPVATQITSKDAEASGTAEAGPNTNPEGTEATDVQSTEPAARKFCDVNDQDNASQGPLSWAVQRGDLHGVKLLLEYGADINDDDEHGCTAIFHFANRAGSAVDDDWEMLRTLYEAGADLSTVTKTGDTPLSRAVAKHDEKIIFAILDLMLGKKDVFKEEVVEQEKEASEDQEKANTEEGAEGLKTDEEGSNVVETASPEVPNEATETARTTETIHTEAVNGSTNDTSKPEATTTGDKIQDQVVAPVQTDPPIQAGPDAEEPTSIEKETAAPEIDNEELQRILTQENNSGQTLLHLAVEREGPQGQSIYSKVMTLLQREKAEQLLSRKTGSDGWTLLHTAASNWNTELLDCLIKEGIDTTTTTSSTEETAFDLAVKELLVHDAIALGGSRHYECKNCDALRLSRRGWMENQSDIPPPAEVIEPAWEKLLLSISHGEPPKDPENLMKFAQLCVRCGWNELLDTFDLDLTAKDSIGWNLCDYAKICGTEKLIPCISGHDQGITGSGGPPKLSGVMTHYDKPGVTISENACEVVIDTGEDMDAWGVPMLVGNNPLFGKVYFEISQSEIVGDHTSWSMGYLISPLVPDYSDSNGFYPSRGLYWRGGSGGIYGHIRGDWDCQFYDSELFFGTAEDTVGIGFNTSTGQVVMTKNGKQTGPILTLPLGERYYPGITMSGSCKLTYNFGAQPFKWTKWDEKIDDFTEYKESPPEPASEAGDDESTAEATMTDATGGTEATISTEATEVTTNGEEATTSTPEGTLEAPDKVNGEQSNGEALKETAENGLGAETVAVVSPQAQITARLDELSKAVETFKLDLSTDNPTTTDVTKSDAVAEISAYIDALMAKMRSLQVKEVKVKKVATFLTPAHEDEVDEKPQAVSDGLESNSERQETSVPT